MSLETEIEELQRHREEELRTLRFAAARTQRGLAHALDPGRQIRKHLGLTVSAAALAGFLLAPGGRKERGAAKEKAEESPKRETHPDHLHNPLKAAMTLILTEAVANVNWQEVFGQIRKKIGEMRKHAETPMVDIANAGTARANEKIGGRFAEQEGQGPEI